MPLTTQQKQDVTRRWVTDVYVLPNAAAVLSTDDVFAAAGQVDTAFDTTLNAAVGFAGGNATILQAINIALPSPFDVRATTSQKALLVSYVMYARTGLI